MLLISFIGEHLGYFLFLLVSRSGTVGWTEIVRTLYAVWPLTASMEVKKKYAYVITQDICNKFIELKFFVGCMVSLPNRLLQDSTTMSIINKIAILFFFRCYDV